MTTSRRVSRPFRPALDALEDRLVPTTLLPLGGETLANETIAGVQGTADQDSWGHAPHSVASAADGSFVTVWRQAGVGGPDTIYFRRFDANGSPLTGEQVVAAANFKSNPWGITGSVLSPIMAMDDQGRFAVAWMDYNASVDGYSVYARTYSASGTPGNVITVAAASGTVKPELSSVAMDADGDFAVLFKRSETKGFSTTRSLLVQRYNAAGQAQGSVAKIADLVLINGQATLAMDGTGNFVVAWDESTSNTRNNTGLEVFAQRFDRAGKKLGGSFRVTNGTADVQWQAGVAMNDAGRFVVSWYDRTISSRVAQVFNANGTRSGGNVVIGPGHEQRVGAAMDDQGNVVFASGDGNFDGSNYYGDVRAQWLSSTGQLGPAVTVNTTTEGLQGRSSVALTPGGFVVAWGGVGAADADGGTFFQRFAVAQELRAEGQPGHDVGTALTPSQADTLLASALSQWRRAGASLSALRGINVQVTDLPGDQLGLAVGKTIYLDVNAAGFGWFVDRTPGDSREFSRGRAVVGAAKGKMDALTVLGHEVGHAIGRGHDDHGLMAEILRAGERHLPAPAKAHAALDSFFARWNSRFHA